ncbi:MAG: phospholipase D-like domain-containing protein [Chloroflexota bacterium]|nr:phospholipase D-like domain-containing protein [Chloroflexota bacterium]
MRHVYAPLKFSVAAAALFIGLAVGPRPTPVPPTPPPVATPAISLPTLQVFGPGGVESPVQAQIDGARQRVLIEAYALDDPAVLAALRRAAQRGVDVRVMLDPRGLNTTTTLSQLAGVGVRTRTPNPGYVTHLDMVVVDTSAVTVLTSFMSVSNLGFGGHAYAVVDRDRLDALQAASLFYDDWLRRPVRLFGHNLIVLPDNAAAIAAQINAAGSRVELYTSGISDPTILASLRAARARGVVARVLTKVSSNSTTLRDAVPTRQVRFRDDGGGTVLVIDRRTVILGSMDLSANTLKNNRELAVVVGGGDIASLVDRSFFAEFARGQALNPTPVTPVKHGRTAPRGKLTVKPIVPSLVRVGGEGLIVVSTAANARVSVTITYPPGSTATTPAGSGQADGHGSFVYRWIVPTGIKSGRALARIVARSGAQTVFDTVNFDVAQ